MNRLCSTSVDINCTSFLGSGQQTTNGPRWGTAGPRWTSGAPRATQGQWNPTLPQRQTTQIQRTSTSRAITEGQWSPTRPERQTTQRGWPATLRPFTQSHFERRRPRKHIMKRSSFPSVQILGGNSGTGGNQTSWNWCTTSIKHHHRLLSATYPSGNFSTTVNASRFNALPVQQHLSPMVF